jgi:GntR family transcriptional regulator, transcriptional repressor for pyruvate dehydrogenase complex
VYVGRDRHVLVMASRDVTRSISAKTLADIVAARIPLELESVTAAARLASDGEIAALRALLDRDGDGLDDDEHVRSTDEEFHRLVAIASRNVVLAQVLDVLRELLVQHDVPLGGRACRAACHRQHHAIADAIAARDETSAAECMRVHLTSERIRLTGQSETGEP